MNYYFAGLVPKLMKALVGSPVRRYWLPPRAPPRLIGHRENRKWDISNFSYSSIFIYRQTICNLYLIIIFLYPYNICIQILLFYRELVLNVNKIIMNKRKRLKVKRNQFHIRKIITKHNKRVQIEQA